MGSALLAAEDRALGTRVRVVVTQSDGGALAVAKAAVDRVLAEIDMACSRFRGDSELALLNAGSGREHTVSPLLGHAVEVALHAAEVTDGDVDPTVGTALRERGYDVDFASIPPDAGPITVVARPVPGWRRVRYRAATRTVYLPAGIELDLGATAKALAADLAAQAGIEALGGRGGVLVSLGGDIAIAGVPPPDGWVVQVSEDSEQPFETAAERVAMQGGAVATSSTTVRRWIRGGVEQHHIIDPRTGAPAQTLWRMVTVAADTCVHANTASTAAIIRGARARDWLGRRGLAARLVDRDGVIERVGGWPVPLPVEST